MLQLRAGSLTVEPRSPGLWLGVLELLQVWAVCAPAPRAQSTPRVIKFLLIKPEPPAPAATRVLWFAGFSSPESITVGYVFRDGRGKAIQLQPFCIPLILGLFCAGSFLWHKLQQHRATLCPNPRRELRSSRQALLLRGAGAGSVPPGTVDWPYRGLSSLQIQVCSKQSLKEKITQNN